MKYLLRDYRNYLTLVMDGHRVAEAAMERLGLALQERGHKITDEELYDASAKIMESKAEATIKTIANIQNIFRKRLGSGRQEYRQVKEELEIPPEFVFETLREKQLMQALEPKSKAQKPEEVK